MIRKLSRRSFSEGGLFSLNTEDLMFYVYLLRSIKYPTKTYVGYTINIKERFADHNSGESIYSAKYKPWQMEVYFVFREESKAIEFEKYLKSGSGRSFAKKHF